MNDLMTIEEINGEETDELNALIPVRVETALSRFPVHRLSKSGIVEIELHNQASAVQWEVSYNSRYGQPGPLAYKLDTLIINRRIDELGKPAPEIIKLGSLSQIARELHGERDAPEDVVEDSSEQTDTKKLKGEDTNLIKKALRQNAFAAISAKLSYKGADGSEHWVEEDFTRYSLIFTGEKLPNGRNADAVYIRLHPTYRHILNTALTRPLDYEYMKVLPPSAQRLYEIVSYHIHYAIKNGAMYARLQYSTYCMLAPAPRYLTFDQVKKQMYKIHRSHIESGYLKEVKYETITDKAGQPDWMILYKPGPNADRWYQEFVPGAARSVKRTRVSNDGMTLPFPELFAPIPSIAPVMPRQDETTPSDPPELLALIAELKANDLNGAEADRFAREKPEECRRQLDYLPYVANFTSTRGAYLRRAIEQEYGQPKAFVEAQAKIEAERQREAQAQTRTTRRADYEVRIAEEAVQVDEILANLKTDDPEALDAFLGYVESERARLTEQYKRMPEKVKARRLASLNTPEKHRELFALWRAEREGRIGQLGLRLPADPEDVEQRHVRPATVDEIIAECEAHNAEQTGKQPVLSAFGLLDEWLKHIRREGSKIADPDRAFATFAYIKLHGKA